MKKRKYIRSKWRTWRHVKHHKMLSASQPDTAIYSLRNLTRFVQKYPSVFVKPNSSYGGKNVIRIHKKESRFIALGKRKIRFSSIQSLHRWMIRIKRSRFWIIQQGIGLAPMGGKAVDLRTIVQLNGRKHWEVTGMFAKAARRGRAVTNVKAGGSVLSVPLYMKQIGYTRKQRIQKIRELKSMSLRIARLFYRSYPNTLYGFDIGLDRKGKLWLIEVNTMPSLGILKRIDKHMFRRSIAVRRRR